MSSTMTSTVSSASVAFLTPASQGKTRTAKRSASSTSPSPSRRRWRPVSLPEPKRPPQKKTHSSALSPTSDCHSSTSTYHAHTARSVKFSFPDEIGENILVLKEESQWPLKNEAPLAALPTVANHSPSTSTCHVHTAELIKSSVLNQVDGITEECESHPSENRLAEELSRRQQKLLKLQAEVEEAAAQESRASHELRETSLLLSAMREGRDFTNLDLSTAIKVASSAREILVAEQQIVKSQLRVCELETSHLRASLREVQARVADAESQVRCLKDLAAKSPVLPIA
ncbi:hypothetical protein CVT26_007981 [Gymnopilus dilepis]|uniref:Uncharacterized protein n=1 Tax=Gymnopilus dilepis TaxID=231916 RepID=A0A409W7J5_9AGAR|nr:hypothetical protein CVT26_007981 [Gymnopilus dilepis]